MVFVLVVSHMQGETDILATTREHDNPIKSSEPSKHLSSYPDHKFTWNIISSAPHSTIKRKILEAYYIAKYKPKLNEQVSSRILVLFRHGVT